VAGQLLSSLKSAEKPLAALSHETKLGMAVITILFCAFCFLVYHKMDLHEKQRQLASIQPNGAKADETDGAGDSTAQGEIPPLAGAEGSTPAEDSEVVDPLISMNDLSTGSPFADSEMNAAEESVGGSFDQQPVLSLTKPGTASTPTGTPASEEPSLLADTAETAFAMSDESPVQPNANDTGLLPSEEANLLATEPLVSTPVTKESSETPSFGFDEPATPTVDSPVTDSSSVTATNAAEPAFAAVDDTTKPRESTPISESPIDQFAGEAAPSAESVYPIAGGLKQDREPVLLAMADPQPQDGFSGGFSSDGFTADDSSSGIAPGRAPATEPSDSLPAFDAEPAAASQPKQTTSNHMASNQTSQFGSGGFNAVTQPGSRKSGNNIRTAAGSGAEADGKFSLAAFNYQNTNVEPAPDDGSTFDSIKVQNGDNYSKISKRVYGTSRYFSALAVFNQHRIPEPRNMRPGMYVLTPSAEVLEQRYPQLFEDMKPRVPEPAEFMELEDGSPAYRVGERETLSEISQRFLGRSSRWIEIYRMNQTIVQDPNRLKPGIILALPADATEVHVSP
jgi:nucleoid-associated protein YgaU